MFAAQTHAHERAFGCARWLPRPCQQTVAFHILHAASQVLARRSKRRVGAMPVHQRTRLRCPRAPQARRAPGAYARRAAWAGQAAIEYSLMPSKVHAAIESRGAVTARARAPAVHADSAAVHPPRTCSRDKSPIMGLETTPRAMVLDVRASFAMQHRDSTVVLQ